MLSSGPFDQGHTVFSEPFPYQQPNSPETPFQPFPDYPSATTQVNAFYQDASSDIGVDPTPESYPAQQPRPKKSSSRTNPKPKGREKSEYPFPCPDEDCHKGYDTKVQLQQHGKRHKRNFKCPMSDCDYAGASQQRDLDRHWTTSHAPSKTSFQCDFPGCGMKFTRDDNVGRHWKDQHKQRRPKSS